MGVSAACEALGVARATFYRRRRPKTGQRQPRPAPARALSEAERSEVFEVLCSPRFADRAPAEVYATLLDEGVYLCSERTMYRILADSKAVRERRAQRSHPNHPKPEVVARAPNKVWSWDITRLLGPEPPHRLPDQRVRSPLAPSSPPMRSRWRPVQEVRICLLRIAPHRQPTS